MPIAEPARHRRHAGSDRARPGRVTGLSWSLAAAIGLASAVTGCAAGPSGGAAPPPLPEGLSAEFVQLRSDVAGRQAQVRLHNGADVPVEVGAVTVADPRFIDVATRVEPGRVSTIRPGATVDVRIQLPAMQCDTAEGAATVQLGIPASGEAVVEGALPDPLDVIAPLHERECRAARVADAAALSFSSFEPSPPGEAAALTLSVAPTGEGDVTIGGVQATNLLTFDAGPGATADTYPIGLVIGPSTGSGGEGIVEFDLPLVPLRCDPHAVQEDKRGTIFTLEVETPTGSAGGESGTIELAAPADLRGRMLTWVADWCRFGS